MIKVRPLWERLYFNPVYTEVARVIGYQGCLYRELYAKLEPLHERFGKVRVESAASHLLTYEGQFTCNPKPLAEVSLRAEVRTLCWQLLGPPPEHPDYELYRTLNPLPAEEAPPTPAPPSKPKRARKKKGDV